MAVNRDKVLRAAEKLVQKGKVEQAIKEYEKLLKANPNDSNTINRIGDLYGRVGQVDKAIELYERIADNFTEDGFATKAIAILKKINRLAPQRLDIFKKLADLYMQQGLLVEAQNQYQILADWYAKNDDVPQAIEIHKKLVQLDPNNHMAHLRLADLLMQTGETDEAIHVYDRLGALLLEREKYDEAERLYRHALDASPPRGDFVAPLCSALLEAGRATTAREFLTEAIRLSPENHDLRVLEVRILLTFGEANAAKNKADAILAERPDDAGLRELVGQAMIAAGQAGEARELLIPAVEARLKRGDNAGAQQAVQPLIKAMPQDRKVLEVAVRAYQPGGDSEMLFTLKAALADSAFRASDGKAARALYRELLSQEPDNKLFKQRLQQLQNGETGEQAASAAAVEESVPVVAGPAPAPEPVVEPELAPAAPAGVSSTPEFNPKERLAEANVFAKYGLVEKALAHLRQIIEAFPDEVEAREKLVFLLVEKAERDEALKVGAPLVEHYLAAGNEAACQALLKALPELDTAAAAAPEMPLAEVPDVMEIEEEEVLLVDIEEEPAPPPPAEVEEPAAAAADPAISFDLAEDQSGGELEIEFDANGTDPLQGSEPLELEVEAEPAQGEVAATELEQEAAPEPAPELVFEEEPQAPEPEFDPPDEAVAPPQEAAVPPARKREPTGAFRALDELDAIARGAGTHSPAARAPSAGRTQEPPAATATTEGPAAPTAEAPAEEMVEISASLSGPSQADLEQTDFYIQQELFEDAIRMLGRLESEYPNDSEVAERRLLLKSKGVLLDEVATVSEGPEELFADEEDFFDLAKELEDELAEEEALVEEATGRSKDEAQLEEVFREFQKGVAEQLSEEDSDTHFNLGIAYKEMGLLPEAIREFQVASRDPRMFVECCSMIGVCYVEQGMAGQAAEWYSKALTAPDLAPESRMALNYELAATLENAGETGQALEIFQDLESQDPTFRDVGRRVTMILNESQVN